MKRPALYLFGVVLTAGGICATCVAIRFVGNRIACQTEERLKIEDPSGYLLEVEDTTCATLVTDEAINVYARKAAPKGAWLFWRWKNQRVLLFSYGPGRQDAPLPSITHPSQSTILVSIPEVSEVFYQNRKWANMTVNYNIGKVYYPHTPTSK
jgi:hypothetical protein